MTQGELGLVILLSCVGAVNAILAWQARKQAQVYRDILLTEKVRNGAVKAVVWRWKWIRRRTHPPVVDLPDWGPLCPGMLVIPERDEKEILYWSKKGWELVVCDMHCPSKRWTYRTH